VLGFGVVALVVVGGELVEDGAGGTQDGLGGVADLVGVPAGPSGDVAEGVAAGVQALRPGDE